MSYIVREYLCPVHGRFDVVEYRSTEPDVRSCFECGARSEFVMSAPSTKRSYSGFERGSSDAPPPGALDTRPLADGMATGEFKNERARGRREARLMKLPRNVRRVVEKVSR